VVERRGNGGAGRTGNGEVEVGAEPDMSVGELIEELLEQVARPDDDGPPLVWASIECCGRRRRRRTDDPSPLTAEVYLCRQGAESG